MYITGNYLARSTRSCKCTFYMLYEDYVETQMSFMKDLSLLLQRFARDLGEEANLMVPFVEDIKEINHNVLNKNWTKEQLQTISNTPGMLMIDVEFVDFNPQKNQWIYFSFSGENELKEIGNLLKGIANIVKQGKCNIFQEALKIKQKENIQQLVETIEIKPQIMGISIDLKEAMLLIRKIKNSC